MKYLASLLLFVTIGFGILPVMTFAIEPNEPKFEAFLKGISWDKQDYIDYIEGKEWHLKDFESVDELGTPLTEDSIQSVLQEFQLTREELNALLIENGDIEKGQDVLEGTSIIFAEELHLFVGFYLNDDWEGMPSQDEISGLFTEMGLTDEELEKLSAHLETLNLEDPAFSEKLMALGERMMAFEDFETAAELSAEQTAELMDIFSSMLELLQVETKYYLVKDGEKQTVSFSALMTMDTPNGYDLLVEVYSHQGEFLADVLLTAGMFGSELLQETGEDLEKVEQIGKVGTEPPVKTVKGGKLPTTASGHAGNALAGFAFLLAGVFLFRRVNVKGN